jgi:hypothetical protein
LPSLGAAVVNPATTITTTTETLCVNIPPIPLFLPAGSPQVLTIEVTLWITTGTGVTALQAKLRTGQNNTTTAQVGQTAQVVAIASTLQAVNVMFFDVTPADLASGYSVTISQIGATGNGTVTSAGYQVFSTP